jgi:hypothetical protein
MSRLKDRLDSDGLAGEWSTERGYIIRLGRARAIFLSADESSRVVGHTAHLLLEIDEAQDVSKEKYTKEFKPMAATTNAVTVLYGTAWDDSTLLEEVKQTNLELERKDGIKRISATIGRRSPDSTRTISGMLKEKDSDWVTTTLYSVASTVCCPSVPVEAFCLPHSAPRCRAITPVSMLPSRAASMSLASISRVRPRNSRDRH